LVKPGAGQLVVTLYIQPLNTFIVVIFFQNKQPCSKLQRIIQLKFEFEELRDNSYRDYGDIFCRGDGKPVNKILSIPGVYFLRPFGACWWLVFFPGIKIPGYIT